MGRSCPRFSPSTSYGKTAEAISGDPAVVQLTVTVPELDDADRIAALLLDRRLAACVQVAGPVRSHYVWKGERETSVEHLVFVKTTTERAQAAVDAIVDAHPYDVPEVIVTAVAGGHQPYLDWVTENVD